MGLKHPDNQKQLKSFLRAIQYLVKFRPRLSKRTEKLRKLLKKIPEWNWETEENNFEMTKNMLSEQPCLAHYAKDKNNIVTTDASKSGLGITLRQKQTRRIETNSFGTRFLNESEKKYSIGELEFLAVVLGLEKFRFYLYGKKVFLYNGHQAFEPLIKRNRCNKQYDARLIRLLDQLAHVDISKQYITGSNPKIRATTENMYDEQNVINILTDQAELNLKHGRIFTNQSQHASKNRITHERK